MKALQHLLVEGRLPDLLAERVDGLLRQLGRQRRQYVRAGAGGADRPVDDVLEDEREPEYREGAAGARPAAWSVRATL